MTALLLVVALVGLSIAQNNHYSPPCTSSSPTNQCACDIQQTFSTSYVTFVTNSGAVSSDNVCQTYFSLPDDPCSFVAYFSQVRNNGSVDISTYIVNCASSNTAIFTSPSCSFARTVIGRVGLTSAYVRQIISGECPDIAYVIGLSSCPNVETANKLPQIKQLLNNNGIGCTDILFLPRRLPYQCITQQSCTNTGSITNCPGPSYESNCDNFYDSLPNYNYIPPPSGCGCSK